MTFTLSSHAFPHEGTIPVTFTCDGDDGPPPLSWSGSPDGTRSFALIVDDPDAPGGTFTHWLLYDIPSQTTELPETPIGKTLRNGFGRSGTEARARLEATVPIATSLVFMPWMCPRSASVPRAVKPWTGR